MGNFVIAFFAVLCITFVFMLIFKKSFSETCLLAVSSIVFILFIFGCMGKLVWGVYVLYAITFVAFIYVLTHVICKKKVWLLENNFDLLFFVIASGIIYVMTQDMRVAAGDEFSHWGMVVKSMLYTNKLGCDPENMLMFPEFFPGTAIFQYFFCFNKEGVLREADIYRAMDILQLAAYMPIFSICKKKKRLFHNVLCVMVLWLVPMLFMPKTWLILQVDSLILILVANLFLVIRYMEEDRFKVYYLCMVSPLLIFVKEVGIAYVAFIIIYGLLCKKKKSILCCIPCLLATFSWQALIYFHSALSNDALAKKNINIANILKFMTGNGEEWQYLVVRKFLGKFMESTMGSIYPFAFFVFLLFLFPFILKLIAKKSYSAKVDFGLWAVSFAGYTIYLLLMYTLMWGEEIGLDVTSFWRYMGTFIGAWLLYFIAQLFILDTCFEEIRENKRKVIFLCSVPIVFFSILFLNIKQSFVPTFFNVIETGKKLRSEYAESEMFFEQLDWEEDKVYIISQFSQRGTANRLDYLVTRFNIIPIRTNEYQSLSLGCTGNPRDTVYIETSLQEWERELLSYTYVYIYSVDEYFIKEFGELFEDGNIEKGWYTVVVEAEEQIKLVKTDVQM